MTDDLLRRAARELSDFGEGESARAQVTRARIMTSLHQGRYRRSRRATVLIPFGVLVAASTAWGAATGKMTGVVETVTRAFTAMVGAADDTEPAPSAFAPIAPPRGTSEATEPVEAPPPAATAAETPAIAPPSPTLPTEPARSAAATPERGVAQALEPTAPPPGPARPSESAQHVEAPTDPSPSAAPSPSIDEVPAPIHADEPGFERYRAAHRAHFVERDPARAEQLWRAYLAEAPRGRFAPEARYNRALCLVRIGRVGEARSALEAFAEGKYGGYRQREATELIAELAR